MNNRYLSERAQKGHWCDYPAIVASGLIAGLSLGNGVTRLGAGKSIAVNLILAGIAAVPLALLLRQLRDKATARKIAKCCDLCRNDSISFEELDKRTGIRDAAAKARRLIGMDYLKNIAIDADCGQLRLAGKPWNEANHVQKSIPHTGNAEYDGKLAEIRHLNDEIRDWKVSAKIDRIEQLTAGIFQVIMQKPERAEIARRFMSYYLPTTLKLLESYKLMAQQTHQGESIRASRAKIEAVLDTMIAAMEKQQDRLFRDDVLDIETDITVLETLMAADGFSEKGTMSAAGNR